MGRETEEKKCGEKLNWFLRPLCSIRLNEIRQMNIAFNLAGQTALITGGGSGLGFSMAKCLVASGAKAVPVGRRDAELTKAAESLGQWRRGNWILKMIGRIERNWHKDFKMVLKFLFMFSAFFAVKTLL
jgi:NADPH:quinone reductase-like Zn-dependent oxidoreductase